MLGDTMRGWRHWIVTCRGEERCSSSGAAGIEETAAAGPTHRGQRRIDVARRHGLAGRRREDEGVG